MLRSAARAPRPRRARRLASAVVVAPLVAAALAGCGADEETSAATSAVIQPGRPGEVAETMPPGTEFTAEAPPLDAADVSFVSGMIPHHSQALEMAALAPERASDERVLGLASRISDVQGPEIDVYRSWLADRGLGEDGQPVAARDGAHGGDGHGDGHGEGHGDGGDGGAGHGGMATAEEMSALAAASGEEFDRLWLELMIRHHQGALDMAEQLEQAGGLDPMAEQMAADVYVTQLDEIQRMEAMLER